MQRHSAPYSRVSRFETRAISEGAHSIRRAPVLMRWFETRAISEGAHSVTSCAVAGGMFETRAISEGAHSPINDFYVAD